MACTDWFEFLETLENWWLNCTEFAGHEGRHSPGKEFQWQAWDICRWCYDQTKIDPAPLWDLNWFIDSRLHPDRYGFPSIGLRRIERQIERCNLPVNHLRSMAHGELEKRGVGDNGKSPVGRKKGSGKMAAKIKAALRKTPTADSSDIAYRTGTSIRYVKDIRKEMVANDNLTGSEIGTN